ncbi:hypothetical protein [Clostridium sp.]
MEDRRLLSWYENELKRLNIDVKMNTVVTPVWDAYEVARNI